MPLEMRDAVRTAIAKDQLADPNEPLWVAVSGGVDSMVLLHVLRSLGHPCHVAHVDHGLRGAASDGDRAFLEHYCKDNDIPFVAHHVEVRAAMEATGSSVQMAARELRLEWFNKLVLSGPEKLAMAHHADDSIETFFMGLLQGMGSQGWAGIPVRSGPFIRPLLNIGRKQILEYAFTNSIPWREDASNADTSYLRNRVRHELLPLLETWRPGTHRNLQRNTRLANELQGLATRRFTEVLKDVVPDADGSLRLPFTVITDSEAPFLFLHHVLRHKGFHPDRLAAILTSIEERNVGAIFLHGACQVLVDRKELVIGEVKGPFPIWQLNNPDHVPLEAPLSIEAAPLASMDLGVGRHVAWLDADRVSFPLTLRPWVHGDRITPIGLGGTKLVSDLLIDAKVPRDRKQSTYVLVQGDKVLWLCGHRLAEGIGASAATHKMLRVEWTGA